MNADVLESKLAQAKAEIQGTSVLSYRTRFNLFVHEGRLRKLFYVYSELCSARHLLAEAGSYLSFGLTQQLEKTLVLAFDRSANAHEAEIVAGKLRMENDPFRLAASEISELYKTIHQAPKTSPYLNQTRMTQDPPIDFDHDFLRVYAVHKAGQAVQRYLEPSRIETMYFEDKIKQKSIRYEWADAADWYLSYKTGSFKIQNNEANKNFWKFYIETIIPEASKLENALGDAANFHSYHLVK